MIDLTPLEVRKKKGDFRRAMRGYDPALVDDFLDIVADRMEQLVRENMSLADRLGRLETAVTDFRDREKALTDALVVAQEMREETRRQAARDAELMRREAEAEAAAIRAGAKEAIQNEGAALEHMRAQRAQLIRSFRAFLERELAEIAVAEEAMGLRRKAARKPVVPVSDLFEEVDDTLEADDSDIVESEIEIERVAAPAAEPAPRVRPRLEVNVGPVAHPHVPPKPSPAAARHAEPVAAPDTISGNGELAEAIIAAAELVELDAVNVEDLAPEGPLPDDGLDGALEAGSETASDHDLFGDPLPERKAERRSETLAALEQEVLRELQQEVRNAEKAALLSSVLQEEV